MITITYQEKDFLRGIQQNISELESYLSNFISLDNSRRKEYLSTTYASKLSAIASLISGLTQENNKQLFHDYSALRHLLRRSDKYSKFDPRYAQEFNGTWAEKPSVEAKINQKLEDISSALGVPSTEKARFILWNSIRYLAGKDSDEYVLRMEKFEGSKIEELVKTSEKPFDYAESPFEAEMNGFCTPVAREGKVHGLFSREQFEIYLIQRQAYEHMGIFAKAVEGGIEYSNPKDLNDKLSGKFSFSVKGMYSDYTLEQFENSLDEGIFSSLLINYLFKNAVRMKNSLKFKGKGRDLFLSGVVLSGGEIGIGSAGDWALESATVTNCDVEIGSAGDWALESATVTNCDVEIGSAGDWALGDAKVTNCDVEIGSAGGRALESATITNCDVEIGSAGDWALESATITNCDVEIGSAGDWALEYATITNSDVEIREAGDGALYNAAMQSGSLKVDKAGSNFGAYANISVNKYEFGKDCIFKGKIKVKNSYSSDMKNWINYAISLPKSLYRYFLGD